jgi:hypothetical protein
MILTSCPNSPYSRLFSKQNILITDYGQEVIQKVKSCMIFFTVTQKVGRIWRIAKKDVMWFRR